MIAIVKDKEVTLDEFKINNSLIFALKKLSGDSENDIIKYFYELGIPLFNDVVRRKKLPSRCDRKIKTFYKDTDVQVKFEVWSSYFDSNYEWQKGKISLRMNISFPQDSLHIDGQKISDMLSETGLGLNDEQVTVVERPQEKLYKCLTKR